LGERHARAAGNEQVEQLKFVEHLSNALRSMEDLTRPGFSSLPPVFELTDDGGGG
jgi:hypothetical protein